MEMAISLILVAVIFTALFSLAALVPPVESQIPPSSGQQNQNSVMFELQEAKLKIARLESILDESMPSLNAKSQYIREAEKKIEDISVEIDNLTTALSKLQMAEIVSEQWIQIQQLEQAVQMAEMRTLKVKRQLRSSKCPFVKFIKNVFGNHLETLKGILHPYGSYSKADPNSYWDQALHHIQRTFASARQYHYELQKFVKHEIERNEFPAALANEEVVFLVASALIVFPILSVFMLLFSHLS
ncbi:uncharacterized protein [Nicotiana sylvestris]|uniref:uncharacterized protein isoform X3 n=1 Tax=Nicotiana sylvestris TaxID=4096 RepID=UPI00388C852F